MDDCRNIFEQLSAYLDRELSPDTCREIEAHLAGCETCEEFLTSLRKTIELCHHQSPGPQAEPMSQQARRQLLSAYQKMLAQRRGG